MKKIKIVCLYQVIMHYRLPFYERLCGNNDFDFLLLYGRGKKDSKLNNTDLSKSPLKSHSKQMFDLRVPLPFTPFLFFELIKRSPDVVFSEGSSSLINSSIAFIYSKMFRKKFIWWSLGKLEDKRYTGIRGIVNKWEHFIELNSNAIFTYSTFGKKYFIERGVKEEQIFVGVNVLDTDRKLKELEKFKHENIIDKSSFNIGFIGSVAKNKNIEVLLDAIGLLNKEFDVKLHIIGDGNHLSNIVQYTKEDKKLKDKVIFHGRINYGASKILKDCDVLVLPGLGGLAICEGMLCSLPIITGKADGTEYDLVSSENGFILEDISKEKLVEKISYLINNPIICKKMGEASFNRITNELAFSNYVKAFDEAIRYVVKK